MINIHFMSFLFTSFKKTLIQTPSRVARNELKIRKGTINYICNCSSMSDFFCWNAYTCQALNKSDIESFLIFL